MTPEVQHYLQFFQDLHQQIEDLVADLPLEALNWRPLAEDDHINSVAVLMTHIAGAEQFWIGEQLGGLSIERDRAAEFETVASDISALRQRLADTLEMIEQVLTTVDPARLDDTALVRDQPLTLRWGVIHMIEHTAQHLGHIQLTAQLWRAANT